MAKENKKGRGKEKSELQWGLNKKGREKKKIMSYSDLKRDRSLQLKIRKEEKQKKNHLNNLS